MILFQEVFLMKFILKHRIIIIVTGILLTIIIGLFLHKLEQSAGIDSLIFRNSEHYRYFKEIEKIFGNMENITIGISGNKTIYDKDVLKAIGELTDFLKSREEVVEKDILSLTAIDNMIGENRELIVQPLIENYNNISDEDLKSIRQQVNDNPLLKDRLV